MKIKKYFIFAFLTGLCFLWGKESVSVLSMPRAMHNFTSATAFAQTSVSEEPVVLTLKELKKIRKALNKDETDITVYPEEISRLNGKPVVLQGYFLVPFETYLFKEEVTEFVVGENPYGCPCCSPGPPPTIFNSVNVYMKEGTKLDAPFPVLVEVRGVFKAQQDYYIDEFDKKRVDSLFSIHDATVATKKKPVWKTIVGVN